MVKTKPSFQFITATGEQAVGKSDLVTRRLVRAQARRQAHRNSELSSLSTNKEEDSNNGDSRPQSPKIYLSRFKLASWQRRKKSKRIIETSDIETPSSETEHRLLVYQSPPSQLLAEIGPINVLPIPLNPLTKEILYYYHYEFRTNGIALNPEGNWYDIAKTEAALFHELLATVARFRNIQLGVEDQNSVLLHQREAIRLINSAIVEDNRLSDLMITAVSVLVNDEAIGRNFERAAIHMRGLTDMVRLRGGVSAINHSYTIQRVITWADLCFSSTWGMPLAFPLLQSLSSTLPTSKSLLFESTLQYEDLEHFDILQPSPLVLEVFPLLQSISAAISALPRAKEEKILIANSIYTAEHKLLSLSADLNEISSLAIEMSECLRSAALLYLHLAIRQIPLQAQRHRRLIETLHQSLPLHCELSDLSAPPISLHLLLWALLMGAITAFESPNYSFLIDRLLEICSVLRIKTLEDFKSSLQHVLWIEPFCGLHCVSVWSDMCVSLEAKEPIYFV